MILIKIVFTNDEANKIICWWLKSDSPGSTSALDAGSAVFCLSNSQRRNAFPAPAYPCAHESQTKNSKSLKASTRPTRLESFQVSTYAILYMRHGGTCVDPFWPVQSETLILLAFFGILSGGWGRKEFLACIRFQVIDIWKPMNIHLADYKCAALYQKKQLSHLLFWANRLWGLIFSCMLDVRDFEADQNRNANLHDGKSSMNNCSKECRAG